MGPGLAIIGAVAALSSAAPAHCPAGVPTQAITVVNQAHARRLALARVEHAVTDQSLQLRAAWGTPCVTWGPGGWKLYLKIGATQWGQHDWQNYMPYALVWTGGLVWRSWSQAFSHEVVEMLVDPSGTYYNVNGEAVPLEVADPVGARAYRLDGVWLSDFVLPAWFAGAHYGVCETVDQVEQCDGPLVAADAPAGPYDQMHLLTAPWQTTWEPASYLP